MSPETNVVKNHLNFETRDNLEIWQKNYEIHEFWFFFLVQLLGHVTKDIAIADNFESTLTNFVTGSGEAKILKNLDFIIQNAYNPPSFIVENGTLESCKVVM